MHMKGTSNGAHMLEKVRLRGNVRGHPEDVAEPSLGMRSNFLDDSIVVDFEIALFENCFCF